MLTATRSNEERGHSLFEVSSATCASKPCVRLSRTLLQDFDPVRDVVNTHVGTGLFMRMPTAVWSDGTQTLPITSRAAVLPVHTLADLPMRLATVAVTWDVLRWHFPFFEELGLDWSSKLRPALEAAASAPSATAVHAVLSSLVAELRDNHAFVKHASRPLDGIVPLSWRRMSGHIVIVGGTAATLTQIPVGSHLLQIDGVSAREAYASMERSVSAATPGSRDFITPFNMSLCTTGTSRSFVAQPPGGGAEVTVILPCLDRDVFDPVVREPRPKTGAELATGVVYVDLEMLAAAAWAAVLPHVERADTVVFDLRGYLTNTAFEFLGHFAGERLWSPRMTKPIISAGGTTGYELGRWSVMPVKPRLRAKAIFLVDGRSGSADETLAQIIRDHQLGVLVGELTAGTNGNIARFETPGGFGIRFTGMRVLLKDGTSIHGRGILPEHVVHPTLEGVRAGRDEILEAAVDLATAGAAVLLPSQP